MGTESLAIMQYLESRYPSHALFGKNPQEIGQIWQSIQNTTGYIEASDFEFAKPVLKSETDALNEQVINARKNLETELTRVEKELSVTTYLSGDAISTADVNLYPLLQYMARAVNKTDVTISGPLCDLTKHYHNIVAWNSKIETITDFDYTYPHIGNRLRAKVSF